MTPMATYTRVLALIGILSFAVSNSAAQMLVGQVATGTPAFGSFGGGPFDTVNLGNLNVHFTISVLNKAGRGMPFYYDLSYDSSIWTPVVSSGTTSWQPVTNWGWNNATEVATGYISYSMTTVKTCIPAGANEPGVNEPGVDELFSNFVYHDTFGAAHPFPGSATELTPPCGNQDPAESIRKLALRAAPVLPARQGIRPSRNREAAWRLRSAPNGQRGPLQA
jgi:hypothetical protein